MLRWIKISLLLILFVAGIIFTYSAVINMRPGFIKIDSAVDNTYVTTSDAENPNKGGFVIAYAVLAAGSLLAGSVLLASLKEKPSLNQSS